MNLLYPTSDSDLCDIDNVLSLGFFDLDCGDDSPLLEGKKEDPLEEELLLEKHDLALCTISESNRFPPSDSQEGRSGSSAPTIWLEDEGDIGCNDSHTVTGTDEGSHLIEESSRPFQVEEHPRSLFQSEIVGGDDDIELDHNPLFYSAQSIENLDTMFPEISEKCELKQDDSCLEAELNLIGDPELDQTPFWSILTDTLTYPGHKIYQQQICSHKARSKAGEAIHSIQHITS